MTDRPLECNHCKRQIKILYKEIVDDSIVSFEMCGECPVVERKLHGSKVSSGAAELGIYCDHCHTTLDEVKRGSDLGCSECYAVFSDVILAELQSAEKARGLKGIYTKKGGVTHLGKTPNKSLGVALSSRIASLNEALNEALRKENYEEAAWLRDQIKALTEKKEEKQDGPA